MFALFEFFLEFEVEDVAFLSEWFIGPLGYQVLVEIDHSFELFLDLSLGQPGVLVWFLVAGIGSVVISVLSVKVPDEHICEVSWSLVGGLEAIDVVMGDKSTVEGEEVIVLLSSVRQS